MNSMRLAVGLKDIYIYIFFENERNFIFLIFFLVENFFFWSFNVHVKFSIIMSIEIYVNLMLSTYGFRFSNNVSHRSFLILIMILAISP